MRSLFYHEYLSRHVPIATWVGGAHVLTGFAVLLGGRGVMRATPLSFLSDHVSNDISIVAAMLFFAGMFAIVPAFKRVTHPIFMLLVAPQQLLLLSHLISAEIAIVSGHYPDGYFPSGGSWFIMADQLWVLVIVLFHTMEYTETF